MADMDVEGSRASERSRNQPKAAVAIICMVLVVVGIVVVSFVQGGRERFKDELNTPVSHPEVAAALEGYSWSELSTIANEIGQASDEAAALEVAKAYHLIGADGKFTGEERKSVTLTDGTQTSVQIVGFGHDDATKGGKAGITFMFTDVIGLAPMNGADSNAGGWEDSRMRAWLADEGLALLPEELRSVIVPVDKLTNNVGKTQEASSVTTTSDALWLFLPVELRGAGDWYVAESYSAVTNAEGREYQLFRDMPSTPNGYNASVLIKTYQGDRTFWWERSPCPRYDSQFRFVADVGYPYGGFAATNEEGIVLGFCL